MPHDSTVGDVAVIIPCYKVKRHILDVIAGVPAWISKIYVVDDCCPQQTGDHVESHCNDTRVVVLRNDRNRGVGGATMHGYRIAAERGAAILVKIDGDGQMDPAFMRPLVRPIARGEADYTKGNRFYDLTHIGTMPRARIFGNAMLSMMSKASTGYWDIFDPTNGYTALHASMVAHIPLDRISERYFFESDMLFRLNTFRARVADVPMHARYGDEVSNLRIGAIIGDFLFRHIRNGLKRIFYNYFLRDASLASIQLIAGSAFVATGIIAGTAFWYQSFRSGDVTTAGEVMISALPIIVGIQLLVGFLAYDIANTPNRALHPLLSQDAEDQDAAASRPTDQAR